MIADGIAEAAAPRVVGHLPDATKSYSSSCFVPVAIALLGGLAVFGLSGRWREHKHRPNNSLGKLEAC
jgi:hypothetical protein